MRGNFCNFKLDGTLAYFIRFEGKIPADEMSNFKNTVWLIIPFKILLFFEFTLIQTVNQRLQTCLREALRRRQAID